MIGWMLYLRRPSDDTQPATTNTKLRDGVLLAQWQCSAYGLQWLRELEAQGHAIDLSGSGYPLRYTAQAKHVLPKITESEPPYATLAAWRGLHCGWLRTPQDAAQGRGHC